MLNRDGKCQLHEFCSLGLRSMQDYLVCHMVLSRSWLIKNFMRKATAVTLVHQAILKLVSFLFSRKWLITLIIT